jgi:hypothetical protein
MKKIKSIPVFAAAMMLAVICNATIRIADNNPGAPNDGVHNFSSLQGAYDACSAVSPYDTVYLQGSNTSYGGLYVYKPVTFIGTGFNPAGQPGKTNTLYSSVSFFSLQSTSASGSTFIGIRVTDLYNRDNPVNNINIKRCLISDMIECFNGNNGGIGGNNWVIEGCLFTSTGTNAGGISNQSNGSSNIVYRNNIFNGQCGGTNNQSSGYQYYNNVFLNTTNTNYIGDHPQGASVYNNIFYGLIPALWSGLNFFNNAAYVAAGGSFPGTGNVIYTTTAPFFVSAAPGAFSFSNNYTIVAASPLLTGGSGGAEQGVYGGTSQGVFTMTGIPAMPNVLQFTTIPANPNIYANAPLNVNIISKRIQ